MRIFVLSRVDVGVHIRNQGVVQAQAKKFHEHARKRFERDLFLSSLPVPGCRTEERNGFYLMEGRAQQGD